MGASPGCSLGWVAPKIWWEIWRFYDPLEEARRDKSLGGKVQPLPSLTGDMVFHAQQQVERP